MLATIVYSDRNSDKFRQNGRTARPGFNWPSVARCLHCFDFFQQMRVTEWSFFNRTCHFTCSLTLVATLHDHGARALVATSAVTLGRDAPWAHRIAASSGLAFTTTVRVINWIHRH